MTKITCGSLIRRAGGPNILGTAGCLVQWPGKTDQLLLLTAARVLVGRTAEQFEAIEAVDLPGKPIGCLYAWSDLKGPTTADVALVHVDPALVDAGIGPAGAPKGTNLDPKLGDQLTIFADGKVHNLTIMGFSDQTTIDRVTPDSRAPVNYLNQIVCDPATEDRCVGAMAMDGNNNIVGMVVGGDGTSFTLVTPIDALLSCTFGGPPGPALEVCTSVPDTAKAPENVTHPDHISGALRSSGGLDAQSPHQNRVEVEDGDALFIQKAPGVMKDLMTDFPDLKLEHAAAILGNIGHECSGFQELEQRGGGGRGWCQWDGTRRIAFLEFAKNNGGIESDRANYGYLKHELKDTSEKRVLQVIKQDMTLEDAVKTFNDVFERSGVPNLESRNRYALIALEAFKNSVG